MSSSESTRRQFLESCGTAVAAAALVPSALAAARPATAAAAPPLPVRSPLPVGPGTQPVTYQSEIYIGGMGLGVRPPFTTDLADLEDVASANVLSADARRHLLEWAGGTIAARNNLRALDGWRIVPRMFIDRAERDLSTTVLGVKMPAPIVLGPVARQALAHPDGESASARAAAGLGLTYVQHADASIPLEAVAAVTPLGSRWFGLDWPGAKGPDTALLGRARDVGYTHLVLAPPQPGQSWAPLKAIRAAWKGPVVVGGIQSVADAREAVGQGADGLVVSNERGRRGTAPLGTIDVLPRIADAVGGRTAVLLGAGVRTGSDVFKAVALGADAVMLGRPYVYGLALGKGENGVIHVLRTLMAELDITLAIAGATKVSGKLEPGALVRG